MTEPTTPDAEPQTEPQTEPQAPTGGSDDGGAALERAEEAIDDARDAGASVAANDDITARDDERAGEYSETPDGESGAPLT